MVYALTMSKTEETFCIFMRCKKQKLNKLKSKIIYPTPAKIAAYKPTLLTFAIKNSLSRHSLSPERKEFRDF